MPSYCFQSALRAPHSSLFQPCLGKNAFLMRSTSKWFELRPARNFFTQLHAPCNKRRCIIYQPCSFLTSCAPLPLPVTSATTSLTLHCSTACKYEKDKKQGLVIHPQCSLLIFSIPFPPTSDLSYNQLGGTLPSGLGGMRKLETL